MGEPECISATNLFGKDAKPISELAGFWFTQTALYQIESERTFLSIGFNPVHVRLTPFPCFSPPFNSNMTTLVLNDPSLFRQQAYIGGTWCEADNRATFPVTDPATGN